MSRPRNILRRLVARALRSLPVALLVLPACGGDSLTGGNGPGANEVTISFVIPSGGTISYVNYSIGKKGTSWGEYATVSLTNGSPTTEETFSVLLPPGTGYSVALAATNSAGGTCSGDVSSFNVTAGMSTTVSVDIVCGGLARDDLARHPKRCRT